MSSFVVDPDAVLDWRWDWSAWLSPSETITTHVVLPTAGVTVATSSHDATSVTAWLSAAAGVQRVTCRITTNQGRTDDRTITLRATDR